MTDLSPSLAKVLSNPILMLEPPATKMAETFMSASCFTQVKRSITPDESVLLSTRPSVLLWSNFITSPMSFLELAPTSWMVSSINVEISFSLNAVGKYSSKMSASSFSCSASSFLPAASNFSMESCLCLIAVRTTPMSSLASSSPSAPYFSIVYL